MNRLFSTILLAVFLFLIVYVVVRGVTRMGERDGAQLAAAMATTNLADGVSSPAPFNTATDHTPRDQQMFEIGVTVGCLAWRTHRFTNTDELKAFAWNSWTNNAAREALLVAPLLR